MLHLYECLFLEYGIKTDKWGDIFLYVIHLYMHVLCKTIHRMCRSLRFVWCTWCSSCYMEAALYNRRSRTPGMPCISYMDPPILSPSQYDINVWASILISLTALPTMGFNHLLNLKRFWQTLPIVLHLSLFVSVVAIFLP